MKSKLLLLLFTVILFTNCSKEEPEKSCADKLSNLQEILNTKTQNYINNDSQANCQALKTANTNFYFQAVSCGVGDSYVDAYNAVGSIDCGSGSGNGDSSTGQAMIYSEVDHGCGTINVTINGITKSITSFYGSTAPSCGASGCATFTLNPGSYNLTATCSSKSWTGTITVTANGCSKLKLTSSGSGSGGGGSSTGQAMVYTEVDHGCGTINVTVNGVTKYITSYYSSSAPSCDASGCATFTLNPGTYNVSASCSSKSWTGTITVTANGCSKLKLTPSGSGSGGGGSSTGQAMIWSKVDHSCGTINVTVNGTTKTITSYYSSGSPSCGASGCATFSLNPGTYNVTASCSTKNWSGTVNVSANGCSTLQLNN